MDQTGTHSSQVADVVDSAGEKTQELAGVVVEKGRGVVRDQLDQRSTQAGEQAHLLAETLRESATQLRSGSDPQKARFARGAEAGAERLERVGGYLSSADADELLGKVEELGRRQPYLMAGAGLLLGIAAGRFLKASSHGRYYPPRVPAPAWQAPLPPTPPLSVTLPGRTIGEGVR